MVLSGYTQLLAMKLFGNQISKLIFGGYVQVSKRFGDAVSKLAAGASTSTADWPQNSLMKLFKNLTS